MRKTKLQFKIPQLLLVGCLCVAVLTLPSRSSLAATPQKQKAMAASIMAKEALDTGKFADAAKLYDKAFKYDGTEPRYLYSAARAKQKAGMFAEAGKDYEAVLKFKTIGAKLVEKTRSHLLEVRATRAAKLIADLEKQKLAATNKAAADAKAAAAQRTDEDRKAAEAQAQIAANGPQSPIIGYAVLGTGVAVGVAAGIVYVMALNRREDLDKLLPETGNNTISLEAARTEADGIASDKTLAAVMGGVAAVGIGVGVWRLLSAPSGQTASNLDVAPAFGGRGLLVTLRL